MVALSFIRGKKERAAESKKICVDTFVVSTDRSSSLKGSLLQCRTQTLSTKNQRTSMHLSHWIRFVPLFAQLPCKSYWSVRRFFSSRIKISVVSIKLSLIADIRNRRSLDLPLSVQQKHFLTCAMKNHQRGICGVCVRNQLLLPLMR